MAIVRMWVLISSLSWIAVRAFSIKGSNLDTWSHTSWIFRASEDNYHEDESRKNVFDRDLLKELDRHYDYDCRLTTDSYRCGFVTIVGAPNMGKSTLLNALLQEDLCITTPRPQTTRHAILGILSLENCQVCLVDTPGIIGEPAYKLQENMMEAVMSAFHDADVLLVITDVFSTPIPDDTLFRRVQKSRKPVVVVINKIDLVSSVNGSATDSEEKTTINVEQAVAVWRKLLPNAVAILPASASHGPDDPGVLAIRRMLTGGPNVAEALRGLGRPIAGMLPANAKSYYPDEEIRNMMLPISPPMYDPEILTDRTERFVASEIIREALFTSLKKELPYCCEVQVKEFKDSREIDLNSTKKSLVRISADIIVERDSQKLIVIGRNGEQVKSLGIAAREKLEDFFQSKVFLALSVKVDKDWRKKEERLKAFGYTNF